MRKSESKPLENRNIAILHPDLGIGGAEQLIINVALALKNKGANVFMYTPRYDPDRCFEDTKSLHVEVRGSIFPRSIFGRFFALCAYIRMMLCAIHVAVFAGGFDCIILDQVSFPIPLLRLFNRNVVFYCHYPDKLLCTQRTSLFKRAYRYILDTAEEWTTKMARKVLVNSKFTSRIYKQSFPRITTDPDVLYPCIIEDAFSLPHGYDDFGKIHQMLGLELKSSEDSKSSSKGAKLPRIVTSLNRYERKKNIGLAIKSFKNFILNNQKDKDDYMLVIAGGYDDAVVENVEHYEELEALAEGLDNVKFLKSISNEERLTLLKYTEILMYTPENEHFGIVPVEAMYMGCIVLACNSGGPTESIVDQETGFLLPSDDVVQWSEKLASIFQHKPDSKELETIRQNSKQRVIDTFSFDEFSNRLVAYVTV